TVFSYLFHFFFHCYLDNLDLHSFPTRRSSDLWTDEYSGGFANESCSTECCNVIQNCNGGTVNNGTCQSNSPGANTCGTYSGTQRSEEHTSELQSRFDLVCRLLLEKKNKKNKIK